MSQVQDTDNNELKKKVEANKPLFECSEDSNPRADALHVMLVGNPNCGKSTIFNKLCNLHVRTGNYPGVTVERHVGNYNDKVQLVDIPGIYSLTSATDEERIATYELLEQEAELIVNIIDACSLERGLYLTYELLLLGKPVVMVLNMWDGLKSRGISIDTEELGRRLGLRIIPFSAVTGLGEAEFKSLLDSADFGTAAPACREEPVVAEILEELSESVPAPYDEHKMFWAKAALVNDECPRALREHSSFAKAREKASAELGVLEPGIEIYQILAEARYRQIEEVLAAVLSKRKGDGVSHSIDYFLLSRYFSLPFFLLIMGTVYYISVTWLGAAITDWVNDDLVAQTIIPRVSSWLTSLAAPGWLQGLLCDGVISGVGAVLGFVPQMMILFTFLSVLEECGYMTRAAFILDRFFNLFGLSGRAFIPYLIGSGCGVPALMTARTLGTESERRTVLFTTTMIPCGAKLPVIIVFAGAIFADVPFFAPGMYIVSILVIMMAAIILGKFKAFRSAANPMLLELPSYHMPNKKVVWRTVSQRAVMFVKKAGTVILGSVLIIWFLSNFTFRHQDHFLEMIAGPEETDISVLADIAKPLTVVFEPMGWESYKPVVATAVGLVAKENLVSSLAVLSGASKDDEQSFMMRLLNIFAGDRAAAFAFVFFNLFTLPCFASIGVLRRELENRKYFFKAIGFIIAYSYSLTVCIYQLWHLVLEPARISTPGGILGVLIALIYGYLLFIKRPPATAEKIDFLMLR